LRPYSSGQYSDAVQSFSDVMDNEPDLVTGFNLVVSYYALGDREKMKKAFVALVALRAYEPDDVEEEEDVRPSHHARCQLEVRTFEVY